MNEENWKNAVPGNIIKGNGGGMLFGYRLWSKQYSVIEIRCGRARHQISIYLLLV